MGAGISDWSISILLGSCNQPRILDPRPPLAPIESEIIQQALWLYLRFTLSFSDVEELLAERGIMVSYETVRRWVNHCGPMIAAGLRKRRPKPHTTWHLDEVYQKIDGRLVYLWRAVEDSKAKWVC
jgi:transposase-like protein